MRYNFCIKAILNIFLTLDVLFVFKHTFYCTVAEARQAINCASILGMNSCLETSQLEMPVRGVLCLQKKHINKFLDG